MRHEGIYPHFSTENFKSKPLIVFTNHLNLTEAVSDQDVCSLCITEGCNYSHKASFNRCQLTMNVTCVCHIVNQQLARSKKIPENKDIASNFTFNLFLPDCEMR